MKNEYLKPFNEWHKQRTIDIDINTPWHKFVSEKIDKLDLTGKIILEIGCGRGGFACYMATKYAGKFDKYIAADFSDVAVQMGKLYSEKSNIKGIVWTVQDIMNIDFPDNYFDIVISCETIEHVAEPKLAIKELYRVTKPKGILFLTTPNYGNFYGLYRVYLRLTGRKWTEVGQPINKFVIFDKTKLWLKNVGYQIDFCNSVNISYPSPFYKRDVKLNWKKPLWIVKRLGINSFFQATKI
jgi:ubiquinone/menaquinone biosynthesis C-methylase UbiE